MKNESPNASHTNLYVGYLPTPKRHRRFLLFAVPVLLIGLIGLAGVIAAGQRDPGATTILVNGAGSWAGTVFLDPYPLIVADDGQTYLLVGMGKFGVANRLAGYDGKRCIVEGVGQSRSGRGVIQLGFEDSAIRSEEGNRPTAPRPRSDSGRHVQITGEIVGGKCYTGAMKPGGGKGHKACAILCVRGGVPALFASADLEGENALPLLRVDGTTDIPSQILELIGEPVEVTGVLRHVGSIPVLDIAHADIHRWSGDAPSVP